MLTSGTPPAGRQSERVRGPSPSLSLCINFQIKLDKIRTQNEKNKFDLRLYAAVVISSEYNFLQEFFSTN